MVCQESAPLSDTLAHTKGPYGSSNLKSEMRDLIRQSVGRANAMHWSVALSVLFFLKSETVFPAFLDASVRNASL